jgi:hypothetical protein
MKPGDKTESSEPVKSENKAEAEAERRARLRGLVLSMFGIYVGPTPLVELAQHPFFDELLYQAWFRGRAFA